MMQPAIEHLSLDPLAKGMLDAETVIVKDDDVLCLSLREKLAYHSWPGAANERADEIAA
jgi:hypothetical protein